MPDLKVVFSGLLKLKFRKKEIKVLKNPNYQELKIAIDQSSQRVYEEF